MAIPTLREVQYRVRRWTVEMDASPRDFRARYEKAVPPLPREQVDALVARRAPWPEMLTLISASAPLGFLIYGKIEVDAIMGLAGNHAACVSYLMGNHTLAERMFRYEPAVMLYAPLHTAIWGPPSGPAHFTFDQPSDQFGSFDRPEIAEVGKELDHKLAALLEHLGVAVPKALVP